MPILDPSHRHRLQHCFDFFHHVFSKSTIYFVKNQISEVVLQQTYPL